MSEQKKEPVVIVVSGVSGSGKSTLISILKEKLNNAVSFHFDDYAATHKFPSDAYRWISQGANPLEVKNENFIKDLRCLINEKSIVYPDGKELLDSLNYILVEEPFGRGREGMKNLVDYVICIDIPAEIALARKLENWVKEPVKEPSNAVNQIKKYLSQYLGGIRELYSLVNSNVKNNCDLVVDGMKTPDDIALKIISSLINKNPIF